MPITVASTPVLGSTASNIIENKVAAADNVVMAANDNIKNTSAAPMTKTQKKKLRAQENKKKRARALMIVEKKEQEHARAASKRDSEPAFKTTPFAITADNTATDGTVSARSPPKVVDKVPTPSEDSGIIPPPTSGQSSIASAPTSDSSESTSSSEFGSDSSSAGGTEPDGDESPPANDSTLTGVAKKIRKLNEKKRLTQVVVADVPLRKHKSIKKGRKTLDETAKKDHTIKNPTAHVLINSKEDIRIPKKLSRWAQPFKTAPHVERMTALALAETEEEASDRATTGAVTELETEEAPAFVASSPLNEEEAPTGPLASNDVIHALKDDVPVDEPVASAHLLDDEVPAGLPAANDVANNLNEDGFVDEADSMSSPSDQEQAATDTQFLVAEETLPVEAPITAEAVKDRFMLAFLSLPNGSGQTTEARKLREDLVALHVPALIESLTRKQNKKVKKAKKATGTVPIVLETDDANSISTSLSTVEPASVQEFAVTEELLGTGSDQDMEATTKQELKTVDYFSILSSCSEDAATRSSDGSRDRSCHGSFTPPFSKPSSRRSSAYSGNSLNTDIDRKTHVARNAFLGITSLEDFVNKLEFDPSDGTITKINICKAFSALSDDEFEALQGKPSTKVHGNFVSLHFLRKTKLGTTSLYAFLRMVRFDDEDISNIKDVMRTFKNAAHKSDEPSSKLALAFRIESESDASRQSSRPSCSS